MRPVLVSMSGPANEKISIHDLSDFDAGILYLNAVASRFPSLTMGELFKFAADPHAEAMGRSFWGRQFSRAGDALNPVKQIENVGHVVAEGVRGVGHVGAEALRTVTSDQVLHFANSSYDHFTADGGVAGAVGGKGIFGSSKGGGSSSSDPYSDYMNSQYGSNDGGGTDSPWWEKIFGFVSSLGGAAKSDAASGGAAWYDTLPGGPVPWAVGAGGLALFFLVRR